MPLTLRWRGATTLPVRAGSIRPDLLAAMPASRVSELPLGVGNDWAEAGELFSIDGDASDDATVVVEGDLAHVRDLGRGMMSGHLIVVGDIGPYAGAEMTGGLLELRGLAGPWAAAEMAGGTFRITGGASDYLAAPLPGGRHGLGDGLILVDGPVGDYAGLSMRRGLIAVAGTLGDAAGQGMIAGSIFGFGSIGRPLGAGMKRGSIVQFDPDGTRAETLPTFEPSGSFQAPWVEVYLRQLTALNFPVPPQAFGRRWARFGGDTLTGGRGEILLAD